MTKNFCDICGMEVRKEYRREEVTLEVPYGEEYRFEGRFIQPKIVAKVILWTNRNGRS